MRLTGVEARELFSFRALRLGDLPQTLVVVGPNGSGKTNLLRVLQIALVAIDRAANFSQEAYQSLARFAASRRLGAVSADVSTARLGLAFTEEWERELLVRFVRAAIASSVLQGTATNSDTSGVFGWLRQHINEALLAPLSCGDIVVDFIDEPAGPWTIAYEFEAGGERFRWVLDGMPSRGQLLRVADAQRPGVPAYTVAQKLDLDEQHVPKNPLALADLLPPPGEGRMLTLESGPQWAALAREFATLAGIPFAQTQRRGSSLAEVLHVVLRRGLVLLGDLRQPPRLQYTVEDVTTDTSSIDGSLITARLFRMKNGTAAGRRRYGAIQNLFGRLTGESFDVGLVDTRPSESEGSAASLEISVVVERYGDDLPIEFAGAGVWEALLLSAVLPDSAGLVAVLDEPARNLHPTLQRRLLAEMRSAPGQFILTTHSPYLVSMPEDGDRAGLVRFDVKNGMTRAHHLTTAGAMGSARLRKALGESADARSLLFARGVVLVEGGTELGALPEWFSKSHTAKRHGTPDALNVVIFSVDGDSSFGTFVEYLHAVGVPWAIVCDGSVYRFGDRKRQIFDQILRGGVHDPALQEAVQQSATRREAAFEDLRTLGEASGIFTLAKGWDASTESFEAYIESIAKGRLARAKKVVGSSKPRQGRHVASTTRCPSDVNTLYDKLLHRLQVV